MAETLKLLRKIIFNRFNDRDEKLKHYCRTEYGDDWLWAYSELKTQGRLPSIYNR